MSVVFSMSFTTSSSITFFLYKLYDAKARLASAVSTDGTPTYLGCALASAINVMPADEPPSNFTLLLSLLKIALSPLAFSK